MTAPSPDRKKGGKRTFQVFAINLLLSVLVIALAFGAFQLDRRVELKLPAWLMIPGWVLVVVGIVLISWAAIQLILRSGSTGLAGDPTVRLVDTGPYAHLRNPIYAGDVLILLGLAFIYHSTMMLLASAIFLLAIDVYVRRVEEPATEVRLGELYADYRKRVPRWFPRRHIG